MASPRRTSAAFTQQSTCSKVPGPVCTEYLIRVDEFSNLQLDTISHQVTVDERPVHLSAREVHALELLLRREGQIVTRNNLEDSLYGPTKNVSPNSIEVLISRLRCRLDSIGANCTIHTLYGIGYLLKGSTI